MEDNTVEDREERRLFGEDSEDFSSEDESPTRRRAARMMAINFVSETPAYQQMMTMMDSSSSSSSEEERKWGGSLPGKAANKTRDFQGAYQRLVKQYFSGEDSTYDEVDFERRFRMPRAVFTVIKDAVLGEHPFVQGIDAKNAMGIHPLVRLVACLRKLAYGTAADHNDEIFEMSEAVISKDFVHLCEIICEKFGSYLNSAPTPAVMEQVQKVNAARGFPGMFASWDCKHFSWALCPVALHGQHKSGNKPHPSLVLEAICDPHLYIWYHHFGEPGSLNDINILDKSSIVTSILDGSLDLLCPPYRINNAERDYLYFLVDGIYPQWAIFMDTIQDPQNPKETHYCACQEGCRKDIERAFGVMVKKWHILHQPLRNWYMNDIHSILNCCIILHNMVVEHHRNNYTINDWVTNVLADLNQGNPAGPANLAQLSLFGGNNAGAALANVLGPGQAHLRGQMVAANFDNEMRHNSLKADLVDHLWAKKNAGNA